MNQCAACLDPIESENDVARACKLVTKAGRVFTVCGECVTALWEARNPARSEPVDA